MREELKITEQKLTKINSVKNSLYDDFNDGLLTAKEYEYMRKKYDNDGNMLSASLNGITSEFEKYSDEFTRKNKNSVKAQHYKFAVGELNDTDELSEKLSREMIEALVDKITVYSDKRIEIMFKYQDELEQLQLYINEHTEQCLVQEAII